MQDHEAGVKTCCVDGAVRFGWGGGLCHRYAVPRIGNDRGARTVGLRPRVLLCQRYVLSEGGRAAKSLPWDGMNLPRPFSAGVSDTGLAFVAGEPRRLILPAGASGTNGEHAFPSSIGHTAARGPREVSLRRRGGGSGMHGRRVVIADLFEEDGLAHVESELA